MMKLHLNTHNQTSSLLKSLWGPIIFYI